MVSTFSLDKIIIPSVLVERFLVGRQLMGTKLCLFVIKEPHFVSLFRHGRHDVVLHAALLEPAGGGWAALLQIT